MSVISLNEDMGYNSAKTEFEKSKHKKWDEWLELVHVFKGNSKQGFVGIFQSKETGSKYVFKISQYINYLVHHELAVLSALGPLTDFCPHFTAPYGAVITEVDATKRVENPLIITSGKVIEKEMLLMQYVAKSHKMYSYITTPSVHERIIFSAIKQVLFAIELAQRECKFTHYDLHSNNVMFKKCSRDLVMVYILDPDNIHVVPTYGYNPVIIDYGFSYANTLENLPFYPSQNYTESGFFSSRFSPIQDPKLFLINVSQEMEENRENTKNIRKFNNIVKNNYQCLKVDWSSGWNSRETHSCTAIVANFLRKTSRVSHIFSEFPSDCFDIMQTLVTTPLKPYPYADIHVSFLAFLLEFQKIEKEIQSPFYCLYILKAIVDAVNVVKGDYVPKGTVGDIESRNSIGFLAKHVREKIDSIANFCSLKDLSYERLICSALCFAKRLQGLYFDVIQFQYEKIEKEYDRKVKLKTCQELACCIEANIPSGYVYTKNTTLMCVNYQTRENTIYEITEEQAEELNKYDNLSLGSVIAETILQKNI